MQLYDAKHCPCPSDCVRHGKCKECIAYHHDRHDQTYCEYQHNKLDIVPETPEEALPEGKEIRLLDYAPCAG